MEQQNFKNHRKFVPGFALFILPALTLNLGWTLYRWRKLEFSFAGLVAVLTAGAILLGFLFARMFALRVQDRVIRLEERLRYARVLPADLQARIEEFTTPQVIALRFASDAELPALARRVLEEKLGDSKAIKMLVTDWRADHMRA